MTDSQLNFMVDGIDYSQHNDSFDYVDIDEDLNQTNVTEETNENSENESLHESLQTSEEEYEQQLEMILQQSKQEYQDNLNAQKSSTFTIPILPMSMLPEEYFSYYNNINQSCDKILMPQGVMSYLYPEYDDTQDANSDEPGNDTSETNHLLLFKMNSYSVGNQQDIELSNKMICSLDSFLDVESVYLTDNVFQKLGLEIYTTCQFEVYQETLPKGESITLKPSNQEFMIIKDQESLLLPELNIHFRTLYKGQELTIYSGELDMNLTFVVEKLVPNVEYISIIDVNLAVDFNIPDEFIEKKKTVQPTIEPLLNQIFNMPSILNRTNTPNIIGNEPFNGKGEKINPETSKRKLSKEELREARLKALTKH